jgi:putative hydrolase of the HAD superfamily
LPESLFEPLHGLAVHGARRADEAIDAVTFDVNGTLDDIATDGWGDGALGVSKHHLRYYGVHLGRRHLRMNMRAAVKRHLEASVHSYPELGWTPVSREVVGEAGAIDHGRLAGSSMEAEERRAQLCLDPARVHRSASRTHLRAFPGVLALPNTLRQRYALAMVTDGQWAFARPELEELGIAERVPHVTVSGERGIRKPDERLFRDALATIGVSANREVYGGNDPFCNVQGAQSSGMCAILVDDKMAVASMPVG